jgi:hypothetical protein
MSAFFWGTSRTDGASYVACVGCREKEETQDKGLHGRWQRGPDNKKRKKGLPHAGLNRRPLDCVLTVERSTN